MLDKEFKYFVDNQSELVKKFNNKYIIIKDSSIVGSFNSISEAYQEAAEKYEPGTFMIQHCVSGKEAYSQTFNSRVIFA